MVSAAVKPIAKAQERPNFDPRTRSSETTKEFR